MFRINVALLALAAACSLPAAAQEGHALPAGMVDLVEAARAGHRLASPLDDLDRIAEILGLAAHDSRLIRRLSRPDSAVRGFVIALLPTDARGVVNTAYARTGNDGLLWAGKGLSTAIAGGVGARWGPVSVAVAPEVAWQQNADFDIRPLRRPGYSSFAYPYSDGIDFPQRFGSDAFSSRGLGDSHVRLDAFGAAIGFSTENLWWGPATRYPILMSNTAAGFPHAFLGTSRPLSVWIGTVEAELVLGRLQESAHFDRDRANDRTMFLALVGAFSPRGLDGFSIGGARVFQYRPEDEAWDVDRGVVFDLLGAQSSRPGNELVSLFARWVLAPGAEVYGEWAREDRFFNLAELIQEPDHSRALMIGAQNIVELGRRVSLRVQFEAVALQHMGELRESSRPLATFYTHHITRQGYTNGGQLLGAWIGPGGDAQYLAADALTDWGMAGLYLERVRRADASSAAIQARRYWPYEHDTALTLGLRGLAHAWRNLSVAGSLSGSYRWNREFLDRDDTNVGISLDVFWTPELAWP